MFSYLKINDLITIILIQIVQFKRGRVKKSSQCTTKKVIVYNWAKVWPTLPGFMPTHGEGVHPDTTAYVA